jgi:hypothetical protein
MSTAGFKRNIFRTLLTLHFVGLALVIGVRFANLGVESVSAGGSLEFLSWGRDLMGVLARSYTLPGFLLTIVSGIGMVIVRYVWMKVGLTTAGMAVALTSVRPALEAGRRWAHWSAQHGQLAPQLHDAVARAGLYGGIVFALVLLTIPIAVWKPALSGKRAAAAALVKE